MNNLSRQATAPQDSVLGFIKVVFLIPSGIRDDLRDVNDLGRFTLNQKGGSGGVSRGLYKGDKPCNQHNTEENDGDEPGPLSDHKPKLSKVKPFYLFDRGPAVYPWGLF
jgi:hypothetical protein